MRKLTFMLMLVLASLPLAAQSWLQEAPAPLQLETEGQAVATWEVSVHDFGQVAANTPLSYTFRVTNTGTKPLEILSVKPSCSCTVADYTQTPIAPGESGFITANYTTGTVGSSFNKALTVRMNTEPAMAVVSFKGSVGPVVE
ncbi:MAG: hypothetical protein OHK0039_15900 [Bacteroidia bacterium]